MSGPGHLPIFAGQVEGYTRAFAFGAGFMLLAAVVACFMLTIGKDAVREDDDASAVHVG